MSQDLAQGVTLPLPNYSWVLKKWVLKMDGWMDVTRKHIYCIVFPLGFIIATRTYMNIELAN